MTSVVEEEREHPSLVLAPSGVEEIATRLRAERKRKGITQAELGARAGYSRSAIYYLEKARRGTRVDMVVDCARALGFRLALVPWSDGDAAVPADQLAARVRFLDAERQLPKLTPVEHPNAGSEVRVLLDRVIDVLARALMEQDDD